MQVQAQKWPRPQPIHRKIDVRSDWSDSDDGKDNQARGNPAVVDIASDHDAYIDLQPGTSNTSASASLRQPNTYPKGLSLGRGRGKAPLANWTSVIKGHGHEHLSKCDIPQTPPIHQEPTVDRNLVIVAPTDRVQTYEGNLTPGIARKDLANWTWVILGSTRARLTNNNNSRPDQKQSQRK